MCLYFHYSVFLSHQLPFLSEVWGNEKRLLCALAQEQSVCHFRAPCWYGDSLRFKCEEVITGLLKQGNCLICAEVFGIECNSFCFVFLLIFEGCTRFAASSTDPLPGIETVTGLLPMFSNLNRVWEGDGKVGNVFCKKYKHANVLCLSKLWVWNEFISEFLCSSHYTRSWLKQVLSTYINFKLNHSGTDKSYSCQNHPHCHSFQRSVKSKWCSVIDLCKTWENYSTKCLHLYAGKYFMPIISTFLTYGSYSEF